MRKEAAIRFASTGAMFVTAAAIGAGLQNEYHFLHTVSADTTPPPHHPDAPTHPITQPPHPGTGHTPDTLNISNNGTNVSWLWNTYGTEGTAAFHYHHDPIANPPVGNNAEGATAIVISDTHDYHVWGSPTISCQEFINQLHAAGSPIYRDGVAAEVWYKAYEDGVDPRFILALAMAEDHAGADPNWVAGSTGNYGNILYGPGLLSPAPGYTDYVGSNGYHYADFSHYGTDKRWVVATAEIDALLAHPVHFSGSHNNALTEASIWSGGSQSEVDNIKYWMEKTFPTA